MHEDLKQVRDLLESVMQAMRGAGIATPQGVTPGAVATIAKAVQLVAERVDEIDVRLRQLEAQKT